MAGSVSVTPRGHCFSWISKEKSQHSKSLRMLYFQSWRGPWLSACSKSSEHTERTLRPRRSFGYMAIWLASCRDRIDSLIAEMEALKGQSSYEKLENNSEPISNWKSQLFHLGVCFPFVLSLSPYSYLPFHITLPVWTTWPLLTSELSWFLSHPAPSLLCTHKPEQKTNSHYNN